MFHGDMLAGEPGPSVHPLEILERYLVPVIEVAFNYGKWWQIPLEMSKQIYTTYCNNPNEDVGYTWDWGDSRPGRFELDGAVTSISRYRLDFQTWTQTNLDKPERKRSFRVVWLLPSMVEAAHTGQISDFIHDG